MSEIPGSDEAQRRSFDWRALLLGVLALLGTGVLVALVGLQSATDTERDLALRRQAQTYEVIIHAGLFSTSVAEAEAALGRYVVSTEKAIGRQFADRWQAAGDRIGRIDELTRSDPALRDDIAALRQAYDARGKQLAQTAGYLASEPIRARDALAYFYQITKSPTAMAMQKPLDRIVAHERDLLDQRTREASDLVASSRTMTGVLAVFGLLLVVGAIVLGIFTVKAIRERVTADADADAERVRAIELEAAVAEATAKLREEERDRVAAEAQLRQVQKMEAVGQLTGGIAHDFNNMLAVVLGGLELAQRHLHTGGPDAPRHIENAMEGANRAAALTRRLLTFSREEALEPVATAPGEVIHGMADLLDRTLGDGIAVETRDAGLGWQLWADRHQLENAVLNLAVNARDAMEGRGTLTIATGGRTLAENEVGESAAGDYATIAVTDSGSGMTPDVLERVFEPFFTTKPAGKGTGLGLSQIFGFVRQSGGEIAIDTAPGEGTTVTLLLPRYLGEAEAAAPEAVAEAEAVTRALDILVVEDDPRVLNATMGALGELGHRVTGCGDPLAAPEMIAAMDALDLIVSDVLMPGQTGPEMIAALGERIRGVSVLFVTGFAGEVDAAAMGGHPVLRKPFTMAALARAVESAARVPAGS